MSRIALWLALFSGLALASTLASAQPAGKKAAPSTYEHKRGQDEYLRYCAVCHGVDGRGGGPLADAMKIVPTDLTRISERNNGQFPSERVAEIIRNGGGVLGHGSSAMLPWGDYFKEKRSEAANRARIRTLVRYIEILQAK